MPRGLKRRRIPSPAKLVVLEGRKIPSPAKLVVLEGRRIPSPANLVERCADNGNWGNEAITIRDENHT